jgi:hypothetical protein
MAIAVPSDDVPVIVVAVETNANTESAAAYFDKLSMRIWKTKGFPHPEQLAIASVSKDTGIRRAPNQGGGLGWGDGLRCGL